MKYIIQFFEEHDSWEVSDSYCMFQVVFSAKSKADARNKSRSLLKKWKKQHANEYAPYITYTQQTMTLKEFVRIKEIQYKNVFK